MKYSRSGRYLCCFCCWPCCLTYFVLILTTCVFHVTAETLTTTVAIKYNHQEQQQQKQQRQSEEVKQQFFLQQYQQSTHKNSNNDFNTAKTISGTISQSAMDIIDDNSDYSKNSSKNFNSKQKSKTNESNHRKGNKISNEKVTMKITMPMNIKTAMPRTTPMTPTSNQTMTTDFPKAQTIKFKSPIITNLPRSTKEMATITTTTMATMTTTTTMTRTTNTAIIEKMKIELSMTVTPAPQTTTTTAPRPRPTTESTKKNIKIVSETATTTKMSTKSASRKLLPPIATTATYAKIKMSSSSKMKTDESTDGNSKENNEELYVDYDYDNGNSNSIIRNSNSIKTLSSSNFNDETMLLYQQQNFTAQKPQNQQKTEKPFQHSQHQKQQQKTTSLANVPPHVVRHSSHNSNSSSSSSGSHSLSSSITPSTLLRLMSQTHVDDYELETSLYAPPLLHIPNDYELRKRGRRGRRQEPAKEDEVDSRCRGFLEDEVNKFVINSPDYPNNYPKNINCTRIITAPPGHIIRLDFRNHFHIEAKEDCKFDYLEIRDGKYGFSNEIGKYCGTDFPPEITSKERYLWLYFHADESIEYEGFTAVYEFIERSRETPSTDLNCTIEKSGYEGIVNSSDIPVDIKKIAEDNKIPLDCMWRIQVNDTWKIQLKFFSFKLARPNDCDANFLDIFPEETTIPSRKKNFCGSAGEGISSDTNILHVRFYAEPNAMNSTFGILYTAFRERGSAPECAEGEFDCQDSTCISDTLRCNSRDNCKFRWDEDDCKKNIAQDSSEILIIIIVFGLILGGMILTFLVNCVRKIMRDQKIIREHVRQSKESKLDEISRHSKARSRDNISMAMSPRQKHSETSLHILDDVSQRDYYGVAEISIHSNKTLDIRDKEHNHQQQHPHHQQRQIEREHSHEQEREHIMRHDMVVQTSLCEGDTKNDDDDSTATGKDLATPTSATAAPTYRNDMGCQTRESLFATALLRQKSLASSEGAGSTTAIGGGHGTIGGSITSAATPQPHFSTFGYDATSAGSLSRPKHATTLRHSLRAPPLATASTAGSIDSDQMQQTKIGTMRSHELCHHHHRHHMPSEHTLQQEQEPRYHTQIQAQELPLPKLTSHQHQHQHQHHHHPPYQHKTKVIIPPLTPVIPTNVTVATTPTAASAIYNETSKHAGGIKPQKQKSDDSKGYIDRNSAPDVIIMTSH